MPAAVCPPRFASTGYAGLDFIKAAFCPLDFRAVRFGDHPDYRQLCQDDALAELEVGDPLHYPRQFPYTDRRGHRRTGTQVVIAHFGLAPADFDLFLGLYTYLKKLPELPADGRTHLTADFIARQCGLPATNPDDYRRIRSRIFRLSYAKYTNSAFWNPESRSYDIVNFGLFNLAAMSRLTQSRRPILFEWDRSLLRQLERAAFLAFDYDFYRTLTPTLRRFYLIANRDGWNQASSGVFVADQFAIHQIGYDDNPAYARQRLQRVKRLLREAEAADLVRPCPEWDGYLQRFGSGMHRGQMALRWSRGPRLRRKPAEQERLSTDRIENDALYAQVQEMTDEEGKPLAPSLYRTLVSRFGRAKLQKHVAVVLAQKEHHAGSFTRSEVAALIDRLQHDHPEPDWYRDLERAERVSPFAQVQPSQLSLDMYDSFFRDA